MKAELRFYQNDQDFLLDLEAENDTEKLFLAAMKREGVMPVQLQRTDAETLILPSRQNKIQFNLSADTVKELRALVSGKETKEGKQP